MKRVLRKEKIETGSSKDIKQKLKNSKVKKANSGYRYGCSSPGNTDFEPKTGTSQGQGTQIRGWGARKYKLRAKAGENKLNVGRWAWGGRVKVRGHYTDGGPGNTITYKYDKPEPTT